MKRIWFSKKYKDSILKGDKTSTIRRASGHPNIKEGDIVGASIGPGVCFATLKITRITRCLLSDFPQAEQQELSGIYPGEQQFREIHFLLLDIL